MLGRQVPSAAMVTAACVLSWALSCGASARAPDIADHWAFRPLVRPVVPTVSHDSWPRNAIDQFLLAHLEAHDIGPSPAAPPATRLRRVTFDLTGLPPTHSELNAYLADPSPAAYREAVERLLASPHYGERWARHWLDVARYADSAGHEFDAPRQVWMYRDWVIDAFNQDKPYDEFLVEQLAGDLAATNDPGPVIATGFCCNSLKNYGDHAESTIDRVNAFGTAYLALTLGCAQCHDHKTDPISQTEYYQLYAFFNTAEDVEFDLADPTELAARKAVEEAVDLLQQAQQEYQNGPDKDPFAWAAKLTGVERRSLPGEVRQAIVRVASDRTQEQVALILASHREARLRYNRDLDERLDRWAARLSPDEFAKLPPEGRAYLELPHANRPADRPITLLHAFWPNDSGFAKRKAMIEELKSKIPNATTTLVMKQRPGSPKTHVFLSGNHRALGDEVSPNVPGVLPPLQFQERTPTRLDLARWVVAPENPLTARVAVNRIWQRYFGVGLVIDSDNFGLQTAEPLHIDLLNWLAAEFREQDWSVKHIHRLIVTSAAYQQSSHRRPDLEDLDPTNALVARQQRLRLEAEVIRDAALAVAGLLDRTIGGPSVFPHQPAGVMTGRADGATWNAGDGNSRHRRGMYTHYWRLTPHPYMNMFDVPDATASCTRRTRSNTPLQALTLLNDPWFSEAAVALARRILESAPQASTNARLEWTFENALARRPDVAERQVLARLFTQELADYQKDAERAVAIVGKEVPPAEAPELAAWTAIARTVLNLDEFITRE